MLMRLKVFSPTGTVLDLPIRKIDFEAIDGYWTLLPKHVDYVNALTPSIVSYTNEDNITKYMACNKGVIVKKGANISISTKLAILDDSLEKLQKTIEIDFKAMDEERKEVNTTMARLEIGLVKGLQSLKSDGGANGTI